jgi:hypothetical protein
VPREPRRQACQRVWSPEQQRLTPVAQGRWSFALLGRAGQELLEALPRALLPRQHFAAGLTHQQGSGRHVPDARLEEDAGPQRAGGDLDQLERTAAERALVGQRPLRSRQTRPGPPQTERAQVTARQAHELAALVRCARDAHGLSVELAAATEVGVVGAGLERGTDWHPDTADHGPTVPQQADRDAPHRQAGSEVGRPVDRVQDPHVVGRGADLVGLFLAQQAMIGESLA